MKTNNIKYSEYKTLRSYYSQEIVSVGEYDADTKTIEVTMDSEYIEKEIPYNEYKNLDLTVDCFTIPDTYDKNNKTIRVYINTSNYTKYNDEETKEEVKEEININKLPEQRERMLIDELTNTLGNMIKAIRVMKKGYKELEDSINNVPDEEKEQVQKCIKILKKYKRRDKFVK